MLKAQSLTIILQGCIILRQVFGYVGKVSELCSVKVTGK